MSTTWYEKILATLLMVVFGLIVLHAPLSVGLGTLFPDHDLLIKSWKEILMIIAMPFAAVVAWRRNLVHSLLRDPIFYIVSAYALLHFIVGVALYKGSAVTAAGLAIDLRYVLFFSLVYVLLKVVPGYRRMMLRIGIVGACIVVGFGALQLFLPADILAHIGYGKDTILPFMTVDDNPEYIRVNSTLRGPNPLGAYAGVALVLVAAAWARGMLRGRVRLIGASIFALCSAVCLWISYSRSSLVAGLIGVLVVLAVTVGRKLSLKGWISTVVVMLAITGAFIAVSGSAVIANVLLHDNPTSGSVVNSNDLHVESLQNGLTQLLLHPFGLGVGSVGSASLFSSTPTIIENQYLFVGHETGWLGLGLFVALFIMVMKRLWLNRKDWLSLGVFASGISLGLIGLLLPVWADDTVSIVWWGLVAIAIAGGDYGKKLTK
jgi:hypothetical protein